MKKCSRCNEDKDESEFFRSGTHPSGKPKYRGDCKACAAKNTASWRERNRSHYNNYAAAWRAKNPGRQHANDIKRHYGLTGAEYNAMLKAQGFICKICGAAHNPEVKRGRLFVDHCHATGKVRALLCSGCNSMLGHADDKVGILLAAVEYLRSF